MTGAGRCQAKVRASQKTTSAARCCSSGSSTSRSIQDPGAFAAPGARPVAARRPTLLGDRPRPDEGDFEQRLRDGLADAVANVESEKERAEIAGAAGSEACAKTTKLKPELAEQGQPHKQAYETHAAERARL